MAVPYTFGGAVASIPLSNLDANFVTPVTIGSTAIPLGNTSTTIIGLTSLSSTVVNVNTTTAATGANLTVNGSIKGVITSGTAVASTSGTSIAFTALPSWVTKIVVMFNGVSTTGTSNIQIQLGTGSTTYTTTGYGNVFSALNASTLTTASATSGFIVFAPTSSAGAYSGQLTLTNVSGNIWVASSVMADTNGTRITTSAGNISLGAVLTAVRITTVNGTDNFDAGSINIQYQG